MFILAEALQNFISVHAASTLAIQEHRNSPILKSKTKQAKSLY